MGRIAGFPQNEILCLAGKLPVDLTDIVLRLIIAQIEHLAGIAAFAVFIDGFPFQNPMRHLCDL